MGDPARTAREMAVAETNALALGVSLDALMENAGRAVAEEAARHLPAAPAKVAILAGPGNNGGDGTCAAHYLAQWGHAPELWMVRPPSEIRSAAARRCFDRIAKRMPIHSGAPRTEELTPFALVIDALLGIGGSGPLRGVFADAASSIASAHRPTLSVDVPTGLPGPDAVTPAWTVTFTRLKEGLEPARGGEIVVREIGIPDAALSETGPGEFHFFSPPGRLGRTARVIVIGGGPYAGAPALAALAALRAGAERATVVCPRSVASEVQSLSPDLVVLPVGESWFRPADLANVRTFLAEHRYSGIIVGMGAGRNEETGGFFQELLAEMPRDRPVLVDADALDAIRSAPPAGAPRSWVLTPNRGELARLTQVDAAAPREEVARAAEELARKFGVYVLAKGDPDLIVGGPESFANLHHHPAGSVGGAGDVLAGVVGSLMAQGVAPVPAARLGAFWVGDASLKSFEERGYGMLATDVLGDLPRSLVLGLRRIHS